MVGRTPFTLHELQLATKTTSHCEHDGAGDIDLWRRITGLSLVIRQPLNVRSKGRSLVNEAGDTNKEKCDDVSEDALCGQFPDTIDVAR